MKEGSFYFSFEPNGSDSQCVTYGQAMTPRILGIIVEGSCIQLLAENYTSIEWYDQNSQIVGLETELDVSSIESNFVRAVLLNDYGKTYTQPFGIQKINSYLEFM
jgi:hypothetical protein